MPYTTILQVVKSSVKALPTVIPCPSDNQHRLRVYEDGGAVWCKCDSCNFCGDGLDLLKAVYKVESVNEVLWQLEENGLLPRQPIPEDRFAEYEVEVSKRDTIDDLMQTAHDRVQVMKFNSDVTELMNIRTAAGDQWKNGFAKYIGSMTGLELAELLNQHVSYKRDPIIIPYYDMPGRIGMLRAISRHRGRLVHEDYLLGKHSGLFMLDTVKPGSEFAIAMDDPVFMLQIQHAKYGLVPEEVPLLGYTAATKHWPVQTNKIVFWGTKPTVEMFRHARHLPNAYVCIADGNIDHEALIHSGDIHAWMQHVMRTAKPWISALKDVILDYPEKLTDKILYTVNLTPMEHGELVFECQPEEKQKVEEFLQTEGAVNTRTLDNIRILEKDNTWLAQAKDRRLYQISNAVIRIESYAKYNSNDNEIYLIGVVKHKHKEERFTARMQEFDRNPSKWITQFMAAKGMGLFHVQQRWKPKLKDLIYEFNPAEPRFMEREARVGWTSDLTQFVFPTLTLRGGLIDETGISLPEDELPCAKVTGRPVPKSVLSKFVDKNDSNRGFWAMFLATLYNVTAPYYGHGRRKIGAIGSTQTCDQFANGLGLQNSTIQAPKIQTLRNLDTKLRHDVPLYLAFDTNFKVVTRWLGEMHTANLMLHLSVGQASMLNGSEWRFVLVPDPDQVPRHMRYAGGVLQCAVQAVQRSKARGKDTMKGLARTVENMLYDKLGSGTDVSVVHESLNIVRDESVWGETDPGVQFAYSLFSLLMDGQIHLSHDGYSGRKGHIVAQDKLMSVSRSVLDKFPVKISSKKLNLDLFNANLLVHESPSDWLFDRKRWDKLYTQWLALYNA